MSKVRNVVFYLSLSLCCFCALTLVRCKITPNSPSDYQLEQTKFTVTVPADVDADIYRVSVLIDGSDTIIYYENAKSKDIQVSVPSTVASQIIVDAYKNSTTIFTGSATVAAGNQKTIAIVKNEFVELLPPAKVLTQVTAENLVSLSWPASANATSYLIYRTTDTLEAPIEVGAVSELAWVDSDVSIGTTYYYRVVVQNESSESSPSAYWGVLVTDHQQGTVPAAPGSVNVVLVDNSSVKITWNAVGDADSYNVYRKDSDGSVSEKIGTVTSMEFIDSPVAQLINAGYSVSAVNSSGESVPSDIKWVEIASSAPQTPGGIIAAAVSENKISITWDEVSLASEYKVQWSTQSCCTFISRNTTAKELIIDSLLPSTNYYLRIIAINSAGQSEPSLTMSCKTSNIVIAIPQTPSGVQGTGISENSIQISWTKVQNATKYKVQWSTQSGETFASADVDANSYVIGTLVPSTTYYCKVSAVNSAGQSDASSTITVKTLDPAAQVPQAPVLTVAALSDTSIQVSWVSVSNAASYIIERATVSSGPFAAVCTTASTIKIDSKLNSSTSYFYRGKAINSVGGSSYSPTVSAMTALTLLPPSGLSAGTITESSIIVKWQAATGAESYKIYSATTESGTYQEKGTATTTQYSVSGLNSGSTYYFKVSSIKGTQESALSSAFNAKTSVAVPAVPTGLSATVASSTSITFKFNAVTGVTGYIVYSGSSSGNLKVVDTITAVTFTHTGLTASTTYYYAVAAMNTGGTSAMSSAVNATTGANAPATPAGLTATAASATSITVKFTAVSGATGYKLYSSTNNSTFTLLSSLTAVSYTHTGLTANTTYYYKISSVNGAVESAQSSSVSAKTTAATKIAVIGANCNGCSRCVSSCSQKAIIRSGNKYIIDASKCDGCGKCVSACPRNTITLK